MEPEKHDAQQGIEPDIYHMAMEDRAAAAQARIDAEESPGFQTELTSLLNRYSAENASGTPDFILAQFMTEVLKTYNEAVSQRAKWRGESVQLPGLNQFDSIQQITNQENN